uniref:diguanylate cyclase n=1 Tax=Leptospirillum ferriphilum TaxID=178606 RepID=A0A7C3QV54_9BACT
MDEDEESWVDRLRGKMEEHSDMLTSEEPKARAKNALFKLLELSLPPTPENFTRFFYEKDIPSMEDLFRKLLDLTLSLAESSGRTSLEPDLAAIRKILDSEQVALAAHPQINRLLDQAMNRSAEPFRQAPKHPVQDLLPPPISLHEHPRAPAPPARRPPFSHRLSDPEDPRENFGERTADLPGKKDPTGVSSTLEKLTREAAKLQSQMDHIKNLVQTMESRMGVIQKHNKKVTREANVDPLTSILNRRGLQHRLTFLRDPVMSLLIFDLDDFKTINDTYGHNAGDEVLRKIANGVRTLIRKVDLFSRFGGDEFIIVMPGLEIAQARFVAERIRSHIAKLPILVGSGSVTITASFGLTGTYVDGVQKMDDLLELADSALYQAKNQGKNQICVTNPIP